MEGSGAQGELLGLVSQSFDDLGMTVTLVDCRIGTQEIIILSAFRIPDLTKSIKVWSELHLRARLGLSQRQLEQDDMCGLRVRVPGV